MQRIEIHGYKSIKDLNLELRGINIMIGANGSGKSNLLSFFVFIKALYNRSLKEFVALSGGIDKFLHLGRKFTDEIRMKMHFEQQEGHQPSCQLKKSNAYSLTLKAGDNAFIITEEGLWYNSNPYYPNPVDIASMAEESSLRFSTVKRAEYIKDFLSEIKRYHFHDTSRNSPFTKVSNIYNDGDALLSQGENLAAFLFCTKAKFPICYNLIVRTIQAVAPYFSDFYLRPDENGNLTLKWQDKFCDNVYGVTDLSDGTIRFMALSTLFLQPNLPQTILLDEPELGLHPVAIAKLSGMVKSVAAKGCQVIIATQSTDFISHFDAEDIITVDLSNGESIYKRLSSEELSAWLEDYTIDELWKRNIISCGQPNN